MAAHRPLGRREAQQWTSEAALVPVGVPVSAALAAAVLETVGTDDPALRLEAEALADGDTQFLPRVLEMFDPASGAASA